MAGRALVSRRGALPSRILIPLANPRTAADLVRIGAALLDARRRR